MPESHIDETSAGGVMEGGHRSLAEIDSQVEDTRRCLHKIEGQAENTRTYLGEMQSKAESTRRYLAKFKAPGTLIGRVGTAMRAVLLYPFAAVARRRLASFEAEVEEAQKRLATIEVTVKATKERLAEAEAEGKAIREMRAKGVRDRLSTIKAAKPSRRVTVVDSHNPAWWGRFGA